jgi:hypothetical protein
MKNSKGLVAVFILLAFSIISVSAQTQRQPYSINDRQVSIILKRLEQSSNRFRNSLNAALVQGRIDQTRPQNDINSFDPGFESAINQFKDQFTRRRAGAADVRNVLEKASLINGFMSRNHLNRTVQNDWSSVRTDLNALANAYGVSWQWNGQTLPPIISTQPYVLPDRELDQLIRRIENGGDALRSSLTDAFDQTHYDSTRSEGSMDDSVRRFKKATDQLRNHFDTKQLVASDVEGLIGFATPLERFMRDNKVTDRAQGDWSRLRADLNTLASAFNVHPN